MTKKRDFKKELASMQAIYEEKKTDPEYDSTIKAVVVPQIAWLTKQVAREARR